MIPDSAITKTDDTGDADTAPSNGSAALSLCAFLVAALAALCLLLFTFDSRVCAIAFLSMVIGFALKAWNKHGAMHHPHAMADTKGTLPDFVNTSRARFAVLNAIVLKCGTGEMQQQWEKIAESTDGILQKLQQNVHGHSNSKRFVSFTLDSLEMIFTKYKELSSFRGSEPRIEDALLEVNKSLNSLSTALRKHHIRLLEGDLSDLDVELKLLRQTINCNCH